MSWDIAGPVFFLSLIALAICVYLITHEPKSAIEPTQERSSFDVRTQNYERVSVEVHYHVHFHANQKKSDDSLRYARALIQGAASQWAVGFPMAVDILKPEIYPLLEASLGQIRSRECVISNVAVARIAPATDPKEPPPPPIVEPPKPTLIEMVTQQLKDACETILGLELCVARSRAEHPELWAGKENEAILLDIKDALVRDVKQTVH